MSSLAVAETENKEQNPHFAPTYFIGNGESRFESFAYIDWKSLAPDWVKSVNVKKPTPEVLRKLYNFKSRYIEPGITRINQEQPLPPEIKKGLYYLVTDKGIITAKPRRLVASSLFYLNEEGTEISEVEYEGNIIASTNDQSFDVGFVMFINVDKPIEVKVLTGDAEKKFKAVHNKEETITYIYETDNSKFQFTNKDNLSLDIKKVYSFSLGNSQNKYLFLLIDLHPAGEGCHLEYSLFRISTNLEEMLTMQSGCTIE
ncbi:MAG: hypothetical protein HZA15_13525 [Nitrospirae bacterium]|nr:hypothetical protein [Nitrospirota bacterium]